MVILSASFKAKDGVRAELVKAVAELAALSRAEEGCIRYDFHEDALRPGFYLFFELWRSREDLELHFQKPYFLAFREAVPHFVDGAPEILTYDTPGAVAAM